MTTESPHLSLPQSITGIVDGKLPKAEIKKIYVHNPVKCRQVEVLVAVKDRVFKDSKGRRVGYWYDNDSMSGLLELGVLLTRAGSIFTSKVFCTKENCIDPLDDNEEIGGSEVVGELGPVGDSTQESYGGGAGIGSQRSMGGGDSSDPIQVFGNERTFHFLLKLENDQDQDFPHSMSWLATPLRGAVSTNIPSSLVREKYGNSSYNQNMTGRPDIYNDFSLNSKVVFYSNISTDRLTNYEVVAPSAKTDADYRNSVRRFSDLWLSTKPNGDIAGTFLLNIESLIRRDSNYSSLLNSMSSDKRRDLINELITRYENDLINSIKITRTRVAINSNEDVNFSTHFEEGRSEEEIIKTDKTNDIDGPKSSFTKLTLRLSESNAPNYRTFSFLDKTAKIYRGATFKYKVSIDSQIDNHIDKILREKYQKFGESVSRMEHYESLFYTSKYLIEGTEFYDFTNKQSDITTTYNSHEDTIKTDLATIVDFMMIFNKQAQDSSLETLRGVYENMNPAKNPSIRVLTTFNNAVLEVKSKIDSFLFTPISLGSTTSTGFNINISDKKYPPHQIEKQFNARADVEKTFQGIQYLPYEDDGDVFPTISKSNFSQKNTSDKASYTSDFSLLDGNRGNIRGKGSNQEDKYSYGIPDTFISEGAVHSINDLPTLTSAEITKAFSDDPSNLSNTKLPNLILELHKKEKNIKSFYQSVKNFIVENSSVKMATESSTTGAEDIEGINQNRVQEQMKEMKFYLNLMKRRLFSNSYTNNPAQVASLGESGNQITNLKGQIKELDGGRGTTEFLESIPWYFHSFFTGATGRAQKISNSFDDGYGTFAYFLTYQKIAKFEYLHSIRDNGEENWIPLTSGQAEDLSDRQVLCRISSINDSTLGFKTDESTLVINRYFMLG